MIPFKVIVRINWVDETTLHIPLWEVMDFVFLLSTFPLNLKCSDFLNPLLQLVAQFVQSFIYSFQNVLVFTYYVASNTLGTRSTGNGGEQEPG